MAASAYGFFAKLLIRFMYRFFQNKVLFQNPHKIYKYNAFAISDIKVRTYINTLNKNFTNQNN